MDNIIKLVLGLIVLGLVAVGGVLLLGNREEGTKLGALAGPDIASPYLRWGGVAVYGTRTEALNAASTTACSMQSPAATSTLALGSGIRLDVSSTTASAVKIYKAATPSTATTFLYGANVAANAQATVVSTTSADTFVIAPNQWINVVMSGGTGTFSPSGVCQAQFVAI